MSIRRVPPSWMDGLPAGGASLPISLFTLNFVLCNLNAIYLLNPVHYSVSEKSQCIPSVIRPIIIMDPAAKKGVKTPTKVVQPV